MFIFNQKKIFVDDAIPLETSFKIQISKAKKYFSYFIINDTRIVISSTRCHYLQLRVAMFTPSSSEYVSNFKDKFGCRNSLRFKARVEVCD
jgi:hypothetical protein